MLVIRMQRTGRKGHAMFRVVVQDSRRTPTSGKIVASLGSYDPHQKTVALNKERAEFYLNNGAQPSERVVRLLQSEGVKLPNWVRLSDEKKRIVRNPEKRRSTQPASEETSAEPADDASNTSDDAASTEASADENPGEQAGEQS